MLITIDTTARVIEIQTGDFRTDNITRVQFSEDKIVRRPNGEFAPKGADGGSKIGPNTSIRIKGMSDKEFKELCGPAYTGVSGQAAIDKLMAEKKGWVPEAFYRKGIGDIALIYGDKRMGLVHLIAHRQNDKQPVRKMLMAIPDIIKYGEKSIYQDRIRLEYKDKVVVIDPKRVNKDVLFVFTGFYKKESRPRLVY